MSSEEGNLSVGYVAVTSNPSKKRNRIENDQPVAHIFLDSPEEIITKLKNASKIFVDKDEEPLQKKTISGTYWLTIDIPASYTKSFIRIFNFSIDDQTFKFRAAVDIQRRPRKAFLFVKIKNIKDWLEFSILGFDTSPKTVLASSSKSVPMNPTEKEKAIEIFNLFKNNSEIELRIKSGEIRNVLRTNCKNGHTRSFWLSLFYTYINHLPEDIITFETTIKDVSYSFKAFISPYKSSVTRLGGPRFYISSTQAGQFHTFNLISVESDEEISKLESLGKVSKMFDKDDNNLAEDTSSLKKTKPNDIEIQFPEFRNSEMPSKNEQFKDFEDLINTQEKALTDLKFKIHELSKKENAEKDNRILALEKEKSELQNTINKMTQEIQNEKDKLQLLQGDLEVMKIQVMLAEQRATQAQKRQEYNERNI